VLEERLVFMGLDFGCHAAAAGVEEYECCKVSWRTRKCDAEGPEGFDDQQ